MKPHVVRADPQKTTADYVVFLTSFITEKGLGRFYPEGSPVLGGIAARADVLLGSVYPQFIKTREIARALCVLALYDIVLLLGMLCVFPAAIYGRLLTPPCTKTTAGP